MSRAVAAFLFTVFDGHLAFDPDQEIVMGATAAVHLADPILQAYGLGKLDDVSSASVSQHLERCDTCQQRVAELSSDEFLGRLQQAKVMPDRAASGWSPSAGSSTEGISGPIVPPPPADTLPPELVDHPDWEIVRELGRGGMGVVYLANNRLMGRPEVLKVVGRHLIERPGVADRFLREIRSAGRLQHPNIVTAYSARQLGQSVVFAMEYVKGYDLAKLVKSSGPLPIAHSCHFIHQAALGLQHALENEMVHRDIKPANLIVRGGKKGILKVLDFGLAKVTSEGESDSNLTREGQMVGTPDYIAPEQIRDAKSADIRADIYSLGCALYYLLSGSPPFRGAHLWDIYQAHFSMDAGPLNLVRPEVPVELAAVVAKMMAKEPGRRFQTPGEVARALTPFFRPIASSPVRSHAEVSQLSPSNDPAQDPGVGLHAARPAIANPAPALASREPSKTSAGDATWESLIAVKETRPSCVPPKQNPRSLPEADPSRPRPWRSRKVIAACAGFGFIALGVIIYISTEHGRVRVDLGDSKNRVKVEVDGANYEYIPNIEDSQYRHSNSRARNSVRSATDAANDPHRVTKETSNSEITVTEGFDKVDGEGSSTVNRAGLKAASASAAELIKNPSCEEPVLGSRIPHWEAVAGAWIAGNEVAPADGLAYFSPGKVAHAELVQFVDVREFAQEIDDGKKSFAFKGYVRSWKENNRPADLSKIAIDFLDGSKSSLLNRFNSDDLCSQDNWEQIDKTLLAPKGTRWIQVRLISRRRSGTACDAWYDDLSLKPLMKTRGGD
jgi:serine/threonine protein kinase